jgi:hypothetical protein
MRFAASRFAGFAGAAENQQRGSRKQPETTSSAEK